MKPFLNFMRESESDNGRSGFSWDSNPNTQEALGDVSQGITPQVAARMSERGGWRTPPAEPSQRYMRTLTEARRLLDRAMRGDRRAFLTVQEALTTSDFGVYFGDVLDRSVLANYQETPYTWDMYAERSTISDMRQAKIFRFDRGASPLDGPIVPNSYGASGSGPTGLEQVTEYPLRPRVASQYVDQLYKFGARVDFAMEVIMNDDLDALKDTPALLGRAARRTEESRATKLFASSTGPNATFFSTANKNVVTAAVLPNLSTAYGLNDNPSFSAVALQAAMAVAAQQLDLDGQPISIEDYILVYPPQLKAIVKNVLGAKELWLNQAGGTVIPSGTGATESATSGARLIVANWSSGLVREALNYYLPIVDTTSGTTAWYLFANPKGGRPAMRLSFLRSQQGPRLFMKLPNQVAIGEGMMGPGQGVMPGTANVNPLEGDFETDAIDYKIRLFLGGTLLDPKCAVASDGTNS